MINQLRDMFIRIQNAQLKKYEKIRLYQPTNKNCIRVLEILEKEGFISGFEINKETNAVFVYLKYTSRGIPAINKITLISKPGRILSVKIRSLWNMQNGVGIYVLSTIQGLMTDEEARQHNLGGVVLFNIY